MVEQEILLSFNGKRQHNISATTAPPEFVFQKNIQGFHGFYPDIKTEKSSF